MKNNYYNQIRKITLIVIAMFVLHTEATSQVWIGFMAGSTSTNFKRSGDMPSLIQKTATYNSARRIRIAVNADFAFNEWLHFTPEVSYHMIGSVQRIDSTFTNFAQPPYTANYQTVNNYDFSYIQIPLLFRTEFQLTYPKKLYPFENSGKPLFINFMAGPYIGYGIGLNQLGSSTTTIDSAITIDKEVDAQFKQEYKLSQVTKVSKIDFGLQLGVGLKWKIARKSFLYLDVRYSMGMSNMNKGHWNYQIPLDDDATKTKVISPILKNSGTMINIGYITHFSQRRYQHLLN